MNLSDYSFDFPKNLIATRPAHPRDSAKLLVYDRRSKKTFFDTFLNLPKYLPQNAVIVFNQTKVIPARLIAQKPSGGKVEILYLDRSKKTIHALLNKKVETGTTLSLTKQLSFSVIKKLDKGYELRPSFPLSKLDSVLNRYGKTPLPPYIKDSPLSEKRLREEYQTIFSKTKGSVAAPTASLHFSKRLLQKLKQAGIQIEFVTLHVGLGTFAPVTSDQIKQKRLHKEFYEIDKKTAARLNQAKKEQRPIIAVGTTVIRTLESSSNTSGKLKKLNGSTDLFIQPGYKFKFINSIITNFHVPESSLLMLVSSFVNRKTILNLYKNAITKRFRLFSFGAGMLLK